MLYLQHRKEKTLNNTSRCIGNRQTYTMKTSLSKSRYTRYCQCPKALWLSINKPDEATVDAGVEARFAEGMVR